MSLPSVEELFAFANELADASGKIINGYFRQPLDVEHKADDSPVTVADRAAEQAMRKLIVARFADHGIYGEEFGQEVGERYTWVLDPIDGTKSFINGMPTFGSLIALLDGDRPILGVIDAPALAERWIGIDGVPAHYSGEAACKTRDCQDITRASLLSTSIDMFTGPRMRQYERLSSAARMRRFGGDCYSYGLLALGLIDVVCEAQMEPYDYLAQAPIIDRAGGVISDWQGQPLGLRSDGTVLATATKALHQQALAILNAR